MGEKKVMDKHQKTQNAVMSVVTNSHIMSNTVEMLRRLEWLNIENKARLQTCYKMARVHREKVAPSTRT